MNFKTMIKSPVKVIMFFLALVLLGILSYKKLPLNLFPDIQTPRITLVVTTSRLSAQETERRLTPDFERQLASIKGVRDITSYSRDSGIVIHVDFHWGQDMEFAYLDVKKNVGALETSEYVEKIEVYRFDPNAAPLITLAFTSRQPASAGSAPKKPGGLPPSVDRIRMTSLVENILKPRFETIKGVAYVRANGTAEREVRVLVNGDVMAQYDLTPEKVMEAIRSHNISSTGGVVIEGNEQMELKFISRFQTVEDIGRCVVTVVEGYAIHLEDLGEIRIETSEDTILVHQDGEETLSLDLYREPDANAVMTARRIREAVQTLNRRGAYGLKIAVDRSREVEAAISELVRTALIGMLLAMCVLWIFLRNVFATLVAAVAIPISLIATFSLMYFQGLSLNIMSLGGLALGAGMLVDNGIVVIENIFRHRGEKKGAVEAAAVGVREVAMAITAATLTTIVVFVPLVYVHGIAGILFRDQALTVVYSLLMSLLVALVLIPMLSARLSPGKLSRPGPVNRAYGRFLAFSLRGRWLLFALFIFIMYGAWIASRKIPSRFFPESVGGRITMLFDMPLGTPLKKTARAAWKLEQPLLEFRHRDQALAPLLRSYETWKLTGDTREFLEAAVKDITQIQEFHKDHPALKRLEQFFSPSGKDMDIRQLITSEEAEEERERLMDGLSQFLEPYIVNSSITTTVGAEQGGLYSAGERIEGPHSGRMEITINPDLLREVSARDLIRLVRSRAAAIPGLNCSFESRNQFLQQLLGKNQGDIVVEVHAEQLDDLREAASRVEGTMQEIPGLVNIRSNLVLGEENYILEPDRDAMLRGNFKAEGLASQVEAYLSGERSDRVKLSTGEMEIFVKNPRKDREGLEGLLNLSIISQTGTRNKLRNLVRVHRQRGIREIMRTGHERTLLVMADLEGRAYQETMYNVKDRLDSLSWPRGSYWSPSGEEVKRRESFSQLFFALVIAIVLVYMVIASILESIVHPFTIMLSVPLSLAGVVAAFLLFDVSLNLMGFIGIVMLTGIVVNNAIVLLDRIRQIRREKEAYASVFDAVVQAGRQRLRPIIMTSLTTILALVPLALGFGSGAELRRPLAIAVIGGLVSSTLLTLWILPGLYLCVEDVMGLLKKIAGAISGRKR